MQRVQITTTISTLILTLLLASCAKSDADPSEVVATVSGRSVFSVVRNPDDPSLPLLASYELDSGGLARLVVYKTSYREVMGNEISWEVDQSGTVYLTLHAESGQTERLEAHLGDGLLWIERPNQGDAAPWLIRD